MQLGILLAVVVTITISENAPHAPVAAAATRALLALGGIIAVVAFAGAGSVAISRALQQAVTAESARQRVASHLRAFARFQRVHLLLWLAVVGGILGLLDWPQLVRYNWGLDGKVLLADLAILAPIWIPLALSWAAFYEVENTLQSLSAECGQDGQDASQDASRRIGFVWMHARLYLGLCLMPILLLLATDDLFTMLLPHWQTSQFRWAVFVIPLAALIVLFPVLLSKIWHTEDLPEGALRSRLMQLACQLGTPCHTFKVWKTERRLVNAAVAGLFPSLRRIFLTDALLIQLDDDEVATIVLHELGHVQRHHLALRMLMLTLPIWFGAVAFLAFPEVTIAASSWRVSLGIGLPWLDELLLPAATTAYGIAALGWYSRWLEHDADLCVFRLGYGMPFIQTLRHLSALSGEDPSRGTWLHPSTNNRIQLLENAIAHPESALQYHRRIDRISWLLISLWLFPIPLTLLA